jgi:O-antigen ligase
VFTICVFVAFMPFEMLATFEELLSGAKIAGLACVFAAVVSVLTGHPLRMLSAPMAMRVVLALLTVLSMTWSVAPAATLGNILRMAQLLVFVLIVWELATTVNEHLWILRSMLAGMLVPLAMAFLEFTASSRFAAEEGARFGGGGQDLNYLGYMYSASVLVAVYLATNSTQLDRYCRWFYWGMVAACSLGTLLTGSRGGFLSLMVAAVFAMIMVGTSRRSITTGMKLLAVAAVVFILIRTVVPAALITRVTLSSDETGSVMEDPRVLIWGRGLAAFGQHPLLGVGAGAFSAATSAGEARGAVAHNEFLSVLVELGAVCILIYLAYTVMLFRAAWRLPRREKILWTGVLAVWFLNANTAGSQIDKFSWFLHVMVLVQAAAYARAVPRRKFLPFSTRALPLLRGLLPPRIGGP